ncbi:MAG TPA: gluconate 2-dehydrogenase subunit 3 family protein [Puia sp.]|nr:gluconate 2-dehydrogenase subunit 3 family protein [Puia sp.]
MNRRKAIIRGAMAIAGLAVAGGGYEGYRILKTPDLDYLNGQRAALAALGETIIPATADSPGATDAGVADFIIRMVRDCTIRREQNRFLEGLRSLQSHCQSRYGKPYERCAEREQEEALGRAEASGRMMGGVAGKVQTRLMGRSFFTILKAYTVEGYCTAQPGATKGLAYLYIPGSYKGCIPLQPGQRSWATE